MNQKEKIAALASWETQLDTILSNIKTLQNQINNADIEGARLIIAGVRVGIKFQLNSLLTP